MRGLLASQTSVLLVALASTIALAVAFVGQYHFELQPCVLCIYQRWPYAIAIALYLGAQMSWARPLIN